MDKRKIMQEVRDVVREAILYGRMLRRREIDLKVAGVSKLTKTAMNKQHKYLYKLKYRIKDMLNK